MLSKAPILRTHGKIYTTIPQLSRQNGREKEKCKAFLYLIGSKGRESYGTIQFETKKKDRTLDELIQSFGEYCDPKKNETVERQSSSQETRNQEKPLISTLQN